MKSAVALVGYLLVAAGFGAAFGQMLRNERANEEPAKLRDYCTQVHVAVDLAARDLASGDRSRQEPAADRFGHLTTFHSPQEIALCSDTPPDMRSRDACWLRKDYECLAALARIAASATKPQ